MADRKRIIGSETFTDLSYTDDDLDDGSSGKPDDKNEDMTAKKITKMSDNDVDSDVGSPVEPADNNTDMKSEQITDSRLLRPGDHLGAEGKIARHTYYHHGIFISHQEGIIDFGKAKSFADDIRQVDILNFNANGKRKLIRINYGHGKCLSVDKTIERAKYLLENPTKWEDYHIFKNNCEHFATHCKTGKATSSQTTAELEKCVKKPIRTVRNLVISSSLHMALRSRRKVDRSKPYSFKN